MPSGYRHLSGGITDSRIRNKGSGGQPSQTQSLHHVKHVPAAPQHRQQQQHPQSPPVTFYPAYCHKASPTWFTWVKLTAYEIQHQLEQKAEYQIQSALDSGFSINTDDAQNTDAEKHNRNDDEDSNRHTLKRWRVPAEHSIWFYLNYPLQFVQLVGVVVSYDDYFEGFWLFTVDDSSGCTIDVTCHKPIKFKSALLGGGRVTTATNTAGTNRNATRPRNEITASITRHNNNLDPANSDRSHGTTVHQKTDGYLHHRHHGLSLEAEEENFKDVQEEEDEEHTRSRTMSTLTIGSLVQVKGTIRIYRGSRQLRLERVSIVESTTQELNLIRARTQFFNSTLSKPWHLTAQQQTELRKEAIGETEGDSRRLKRRKLQLIEEAKREKRHETRLAKRYEREEEMRKAAAEEARQAGILLKKQRRQ